MPWVADCSELGCSLSVIRGVCNQTEIELGCRVRRGRQAAAVGGRDRGTTACCRPGALSPRLTGGSATIQHESGLKKECELAGGTEDRDCEALGGSDVLCIRKRGHL